MNTNEPVIEIRPEKKIQARTGFEPMTSAHGPECKLTSSGVFIAVRITYIRFFTAMHIYDFRIFTVK